MGRPRKIEVPVAVDADYLQQVKTAHEAHDASDALIRATDPSQPPDPKATVHAVIEGLAVEAAALLHDRLQGEAQGRDISQISTRRIEGLAKLAHVSLEAKKLGIVDAHGSSAQVGRIEKLWLDTIAECARETLPSETGKLLLDRLMGAMEKWRETVDSTR